MEKKNTLVITILAVVVLLVLVLTATFAYFAATISGNGNEGNVTYVNAQMPVSNTAFIVESSGNIDINVTAADMLTTAVNEEEPVEKDDANLTITLNGGTAESTVACTYDLVWEWVSPEKYTAATEGVEEGMKEFTLALSSTGSGNYCTSASDDCTLPSLEETNIASGVGGVEGLDFNENGTTVVIPNQKISANGSESQVVINAAAKVYNINAPQEALSGKVYSGKLYVDNVHC